MENSYLKIPVNDIVAIKVLIIVTKRIEQSFSNLNPAHDAEEFHKGEEREVDVWCVVVKGLLTGVTERCIFETLGHFRWHQKLL